MTEKKEGTTKTLGQAIDEIILALQAIDQDSRITAINAVCEHLSIPLIGKFIRSVYERSSVATHTYTSKEEVVKIRDYVSLALIDLLEIKL